VALFGSRARGDNQPDSDIDLMIEVDPTARIGVYEYVALKDYIASLFEGPVDVSTVRGLSLTFAPPSRPTPSMLSSAAIAALRDIAHHTDLAIPFTTGFDYEAFVAGPIGRRTV
jgi:hypothetical protein